MKRERKEDDRQTKKQCADTAGLEPTHTCATLLCTYFNIHYLINKSRLHLLLVKYRNKYHTVDLLLRYCSTVRFSYCCIPNCQRSQHMGCTHTATVKKKKWPQHLVSSDLCHRGWPWTTARTCQPGLGVRDLWVVPPLPCCCCCSPRWHAVAGSSWGHLLH